MAKIYGGSFAGIERSIGNSFSNDSIVEGPLSQYLIAVDSFGV